MDGTVVCWGDAAHGGDARRLRGRLKDVQAIQATQDAFAAILADGSVLCWGNQHNGGDCGDADL